MATLARKLSSPPALSTANVPPSSDMPSALPTSRRAPPMAITKQDYASPTGAEFSGSDGLDLVRNWDEDRVCEYLHSVKFAKYEKLFRKNHINGENLMEMDKDVLKELGIEKVGDRVRLFLGTKKLRTRAYANQKKRNRDLFFASDTYPLPPSHNTSQLSSHPRSTHITSQNRYSRQLDVPADLETALQARFLAGVGDVSSVGQSQFARQLASAVTTSRLGTTHTRNNSSMDGSLMATLPQGQDIIRVISTGGVTKVVKIADCNTCEDVMRVTLRKFALPEDHERYFCFWVLTGIDPDPNQCLRLGDTELWRIIREQRRPERNRLILRRVPAGEPGEQELQRAAAIAMEEEQQRHTKALSTADKRSQLKVQKILGENWDDQLQQPLSPLFLPHGGRNLSDMPRDMERPLSGGWRPPQRREPSLRQFGRLRPPSELIASDLTSYFPDHQRKDLDRTARLSMRRCTRLSKVNSRLSVASSISLASSVQAAPPIPTIADAWLSGGAARTAKVRPGDSPWRIPLSYNRDTIASSMLDILHEELPIEPDLKSNVSFSKSGSDTASVGVTEGNTTNTRYYNGDGSTASGSFRDIGSFHELRQALSNDGGEVDEELESFLAGESWHDNKWMKGALIGQGSFGSVYLALHAVTGELLAVKQVQSSSPGATSQSDARKKKSMTDALKREIGLLRDLQHPNIVQYLGCSSSTCFLNIFLEYVTGGSIQTMLNSYGILPEPLVRSFVRQVLAGLSYLHDRDIIHRDIKGANILVDNKGTIKISDFGISKKLEASKILNGVSNNKHRPSLQGSVFWMAPEVVKQTSYTRKADIWSLGCLIVEMMTGSHPFPNCSQLQAIFKIGGGRASPALPEHASEDAQDFLRQTFELDYNLRPSADGLMLSPFLSQIT